VNTKPSRVSITNGTGSSSVVVTKRNNPIVPTVFAVNPTINSEELQSLFILSVSLPGEIKS
jgi:hypothetical protein